METDFYYIIHGCGTEFRYFGKHKVEICFSRVSVPVGYAKRFVE